MLESPLGTDITAQCLNDPENAISTKKDILRKDFNNLLLVSLSRHSSAKLVATVASWRQLWDVTLDKGGKKGTCTIQFLFKELAEPTLHWRKTV